MLFPLFPRGIFQGPSASIAFCQCAARWPDSRCTAPVPIRLAPVVSSRAGGRKTAAWSYQKTDPQIYPLWPLHPAGLASLFRRGRRLWLPLLPVSRKRIFQGFRIAFNSLLNYAGALLYPFGNVVFIEVYINARFAVSA